MKELSVSVTAGNGSERHNHDLDYRGTLTHVVPVDDGVVEVVNYEDYNEKINEIVRPLIELNNQKRGEQYLEDMKRYERGERKTKPRKKKYLGMSFDYAGEHPYRIHWNPSTRKIEVGPLFRSLIITLGNMDNRRNGDYTEVQAMAIFRILAKAIAKQFPYFHILAATVHMDEKGAIHIHIDYFICYPCDVWRSGKPFLYGMDSVMTKMGFFPELSIISTTEERKPLLFNAFRNRIYEMMEEILPKFGFRLQYGVSEKRYPSKDPSKNQSLEQFQYNQDIARQMQHQKNVILDILERPDFQVYDLPSALSVFSKITDIVNGKSELLPVVWNHGYLTEVKLLNRFHEACECLLGEEAHVVLAYFEKANAAILPKVGKRVKAPGRERVCKQSLDVIIAKAQEKVDRGDRISGFSKEPKRT